MIDINRVKVKLIGGPLDGQYVSLEDYNVIAIPAITQVNDSSIKFKYCLYEKRDDALYFIATMKGK